MTTGWPYRMPADDQIDDDIIDDEAVFAALLAREGLDQADLATRGQRQRQPRLPTEETLLAARSVI